MTIASTANRKQYDGNDIATVFSFPYKFIEDGDIIVVLTDSDGADTTLVITTHYTLTGAGGESGGDVTMLTAPATGETLTIYRSVDLVQETDLSNQEAYFLEALENALDYMTMIVQQLQEELDRCVKSSVVEGGSDITVDGIEDYIDEAIDDQFTIDIHEEVAGAAQQTITVSGFTLAASLDNISVYIDGVKKRTSDLTRTSDTVITLDSALSGGEEIELINGSVFTGQSGIASKALTLVHTDGATELFDPAVNNQFLQQRNAANDGFINLIKVNASDLVEFGVNLAALVTITATTFNDGGGALTATFAQINNKANSETFVDNADGSPNIYNTNYNIHTYVTVSTWESIGPTDSGADNIWTGLDGVPTGVDWLEFRITIIGNGGTASSAVWIEVYARKNGSSAGAGDSTQVAIAGAYADGSGNCSMRSVNLFKVPVDGDVVFEMYYNETVTTDNIELSLVGYGYNP